MSSQVNIKAALETALNGMSPALATAWENSAYTPVTGTAYQRVNLLFADPDNEEYGPGHLDQGYMQVTLMYPLGAGDSTARARGELLRTTFARGNSFTASGQITTITRTPAIGQGAPDGDRWAVPVKIRFHSRSTT